jgi:RHS repeat-associated protein
VDVTTDGLADLVWVGGNGIVVWVNIAGESLRRVLGPSLYTALFPVGDHDACFPGTGCNPQLFDVVEIADINGNGTRDVVHVDRDTGQVRYFDAVGPAGVPMNLLRTIDNGLGAVTTIDYEPSTRDYIDARQPGAEPWRIRSPVPVSVVARKRTRFGLDLDGTAGEDEYTTDYRYRDAYYDGFEKEFRGFSEVEVIQRGDASQPTLVTRHSFHTGAPDGIDNDGDGAVDERSVAGGAEEEPLKGVLLESRRETCTDGPDGDCLVVGDVFDHSLSRWEVRTLHGATDMVCSGDSSVGCCSDADCAGAALGGSCVGGGTGEPGLLAETACEAGKSVHWALSTAGRTAMIEKGTGPRIDVMMVQDFDPYGNQTSSDAWGVVDMAAPPGFGCQLSSGTCQGNPDLVCGTDTDCGAAGPCARSSASDGVVCDGSDAFAFTNATSPVDEQRQTSSYVVNETEWQLRCLQESTIADGIGAVESRDRYFYDGLPLGQCSAGNLTRREGELIQEGRFVSRERYQHDIFGNVVEQLDAIGGRRTLSHDAAFATHVVEERIHLEGHELSMTATYHEGFGVGISGTTWATTGLGPLSTFQHDAFGRLIAIVEPGDSPAAPTKEFSYALNPLGDGISHVTTRQRETVGGGTIDLVTFQDGLGRVLARKSEGSSAGSWIHTQAIAFGRRGSERAAWQQSPSTTADWEVPPPAGDRVVTIRDAVGREIERIHPNGDSTLAAYRPLEEDLHDENDVSGLTPGSHDTTRLDGLGRLIEVVERDAASGQTLTTSYAWDARGNLLESVDAHGNWTLHVYDSLARRTSVNHPDRGQTNFAYDDADNLVDQTDAKGQRTVRSYDLASRIASENYLDTTGDPLTDPVDVIYHYDFAHPSGTDAGDGTVAVATFTAGQPSWVEDLTGEEHWSYDARRQGNWTIKRIRDADTGQLVSYKAENVWDSAGRVEEIHYPDGDRILADYDARGLPVRLEGANGGQVVVADVAYEPSGKFRVLEFGNGVQSDYSYDSRLRLSATTTAGAGMTAGIHLIDRAFDRDPASNLLAVLDLRPGIAAGTPRHDTRRMSYDDFHRLRTYRLSDPSNASASFGQVAFDYDGIGNLIDKSSDIVHLVDGKSVTDIGAMGHGGAAGAFGRVGRNPGDPPGPHALTSANDGVTTRSYTYDDNGNVVDFDGDTLEWDFLDRLVYFESPSVRANYGYDHAGRRVTKGVEYKTAQGAHAAGSVERTLYPFRDFEIRPRRQPTKYVYLADRRVAEVTGTLSSGPERVQRLALAVGWNLIAIAVEAQDAEAQLGLGGGSLAEALLWNAQSRTFDSWQSGVPIPAGSVLWIRSTAPVNIALHGSYSRPGATGSSEFVPNPGLEQLPMTGFTAAGSSAWLWESLGATWRAHLPVPLSELSNAPPTLGPGEALFLRAPPPTVELPPDSARIRFFHSDGFGTNDVITDGAGNLVEEIAYYPYGEPRLRHKGNNHALPSSNRLFMARERDAETGLYQVGARYLSGPLGSFLSVDPVASTPTADRVPAGSNGYAYGLGNPYSFRDPSGLEWSFFSESGVKASRKFGGFDPSKGRPLIGFNKGVVVTRYRSRIGTTGAAVDVKAGKISSQLSLVDSNGKIQVKIKPISVKAGSVTFQSPEFWCEGDTCKAVSFDVDAGFSFAFSVSAKSVALKGGPIGVKFGSVESYAAEEARRASEAIEIGNDLNAFNVAIAIKANARAARTREARYKKIKLQRDVLRIQTALQVHDAAEWALENDPDGMGRYVVADQDGYLLFFKFPDE